MSITSSQILIYIFTPFYLMSGGYGPLNFVYISPFLLFVMLLILIWNKFKGVKLLITRENVFFWVLAFLALGSAALNGSGTRSWLEAFEITVGLMVIILYKQYITDVVMLEKIYNVVTFVVIITAIHGVLQYVNGERVTGPYSNENRLSTFYAMVSCIYFGRVFVKTRVFDLFVLCTMFLVLVIAGSRICELAFILAFFLVMYQKLTHSTNRYKNLLKYFFVLYALIIVPIFFVAISVDQGKSLAEQAASSGGSLVLRLYLLTQGWQLAVGSNFLGVGAGNIMVPSIWDGTIEPASLHNFFLSLLATYGILSLLVFVYMCVVMVRKSFFIKRIPGFVCYAFSLKIFILIFILVSNSPSSLFQFRPFYLIFAYYFSVISIAQRVKDND